jgi:hypothetical protein
MAFYATTRGDEESELSSSQMQMETRKGGCEMRARGNVRMAVRWFHVRMALSWL